MRVHKAILCVDIDGTLIDSHEQVHPNDVQALKHFPDEIQPVLTTGRILHSAKGVLRENGLFKQGPFPLPGVFMNGGVTYLPDEKLCTRHAFPPVTREAVLDLSKAFSQSAFTFFATDAVYLVNPTDFAQQIAQRHYLDAQLRVADDIPIEIIKVMILESNRQVMEQIQERSQSLDAEMAYSLPYAYEINPTGINKANSLIKLLKTLQLEDLPIYVVGDAENDLSLFNLAKKSFAPSNAHHSLLKRADLVIQREEQGILSPILGEITIS